MRNKKRVTIYLNPKIWSEYQKLCSILNRTPSKEIEGFLKNEIVTLKLLSYLNKTIKERKKKNE